MELLFHPRCEKETLESWRFYESRREGLGRQFLAELSASLQKIAANPEQYSFSLRAGISVLWLFRDFLT